MFDTVLISASKDDKIAEALDEAVALLSAELMPQTPDFILPTARLILEEYHRMTLTNRGPDSLSRVQDVVVSEN